MFQSNNHHNNRQPPVSCYPLSFSRSSAGVASRPPATTNLLLSPEIKTYSDKATTVGASSHRYPQPCFIPSYSALPNVGCTERPFIWRRRVAPSTRVEAQHIKPLLGSVALQPQQPSASLMSSSDPLSSLLSSSFLPPQPLLTSPRLQHNHHYNYHAPLNSLIVYDSNKNPVRVTQLPKATDFANNAYNQQQSQQQQSPGFPFISMGQNIPQQSLGVREDLNQKQSKGIINGTCSSYGYHYNHNDEQYNDGVAFIQNNRSSRQNQQVYRHNTKPVVLNVAAAGSCNDGNLIGPVSQFQYNYHPVVSQQQHLQQQMSSKVTSGEAAPALLHPLSEPKQLNLDNNLLSLSPLELSYSNAQPKVMQQSFISSSFATPSATATEVFINPNLFSKMGEGR